LVYKFLSLKKKPAASVFMVEQALKMDTGYSSEGFWDILPPSSEKKRP
jgi:hypothetical protein